MAELLFTYLRISFSASFMILAVLLARLFLRKASRNITCLLWLLIALRLLIPFDLKSPVSLQPRLTEPASITELAPPSFSPSPDLTPEIQAQSQKPIAEPQPDTSLKLTTETVITLLWCAGILGLLIYAAVSFTMLRHRVRDAVQCPDGVWESDRIADAFLLGYWKPRIYLPAILPHHDRELIVAHERSHQSRGDQWWKLLGLVCLSIHWFNPLVWLNFWLMCRDIETACDEKVIQNLNLEQRKDYSLALLNSGKRLSGFLSYPVSFGEVNLKHRIKSILSYRKPGLWVTLGAITLAAVIAVCFMTSPEECVHEFDSTVTTEATCLEAGVRTDICKLCNYSTSVPVAATGHHYDDGIVTLAASCTAEGVLTYRCSHCSHARTEPVPLVAHSFDTGVETRPATCSEQGVLTCTCKTCGTTKTEAIHTIEHTFGEKTVTKAPTCVSEGEFSVVCSVCDHQQPVEKIPKSEDHDYKSTVIRQPTCIDPGKGEQVCTLCGHSTQIDYGLTNHSYGDASIIKAATCTDKGEQAYTCSVCDHVKTESISKRGHSWNDVDCTTAPTCTVCSAKGEATGHNYVYSRDWQAIGRVLEERIGTCTVCGDTKYLRGSYDLEAVQSIGTNYAKKLGFITAPCPGHGTYSKITRDPYVSTIQRNGGQEALEKMLRSMIDELDRRYEDNSRYYVEVVVNYPNPYGIGDGAYFDLTVYSHLCVQEE